MEWRMCQTPWLVYLCKKNFYIFSTELVWFLWGLVMKTQCANPIIKSMLHNKLLLSQPNTEGQIPGRTFQNWSARSSSVLWWASYYLLVHPGIRVVGSHGESTSQKMQVHGNICTQPRRNCVLGKAQQTWIIFCRESPTHGMEWKGIKTVVSKIILTTYYKGPINSHTSHSTRFQWGNCGSE